MIARNHPGYSVRDILEILSSGEAAEGRGEWISAVAREHEAAATLVRRASDVLPQLLKGLPRRTRLYFPDFLCRDVVDPVLGHPGGIFLYPVGAESLRIDEDAVARDLEAHPDAEALVLVPHYYGVHQSFPRLRMLRRAAPCWIVDDSAAAFPLPGRPVDWRGDGVLFSFNLGKPVCLGGGGLFLRPKGSRLPEEARVEEAPRSGEADRTRLLMMLAHAASAVPEHRVRRIAERCVAALVRSPREGAWLSAELEKRPEPGRLEKAVSRRIARRHDGLLREAVPELEEAPGPLLLAWLDRFLGRARSVCLHCAALARSAASAEFRNIAPVFRAEWADLVGLSRLHVRLPEGLDPWSLVGPCEKRGWEIGPHAWPQTLSRTLPEGSFRRIAGFAGPGPEARFVQVPLGVHVEQGELLACMRWLDDLAGRMVKA